MEFGFCLGVLIDLPCNYATQRDNEKMLCYRRDAYINESGIFKKKKKTHENDTVVIFLISNGSLKELHLGSRK